MKTLLLSGSILTLTLFALPVFADGHTEKKEGYKGKNRHLKEADLNNDGKISLDEFLTKKRKMFATMDANNDGFVEHSEMKAAHKKMKEKRKKWKEKHSKKDAN